MSWEDRVPWYRDVQRRRREREALGKVDAMLASSQINAGLERAIESYVRGEARPVGLLEGTGPRITPREEVEKQARASLAYDPKENTMGPIDAIPPACLGCDPDHAVKPTPHPSGGLVAKVFVCVACTQALASPRAFKALRRGLREQIDP